MLRIQCPFKIKKKKKTPQDFTVMHILTLFATFDDGEEITEQGPHF